MCNALLFHMLFNKVFKTAYGEPSGPQMINQVEGMVEKMKRDGIQAKMTTVRDQLIVAFVTPLMTRVHHMIKHSAEICFMDAAGTLDRHNCRVFLLLTHCCAGGVPLACFVSTSEAREVIQQALEMIRDIVGDGGFYGRGNRGPKIFLTDDCQAERSAIEAVYPEATKLLCTFHVLQAFWRYVWDAKHSVRHEHRPRLFYHLKSMMYASTAEEIEQLYADACKDTLFERYDLCCMVSPFLFLIFSRYPQVKDQLGKIFSNRTAWALCYRLALPTRGNNTNNFSEAAMRVLKDSVFKRMKAYNVSQLLDFLSSRLSCYYEQRLLDVANNRFERLVYSKYNKPSTEIDATKIVKISRDEYEVGAHDLQVLSYIFFIIL